MTNITTHTQERQTKETTIGEQTVKFVMIEGQWITSTTELAEVFNKAHKNVLSKLRKLPNFNELLVGLFLSPLTYQDKQGKKQEMFFVNEIVFNLLALSFTGNEAYKYKWEYVQEFEKLKKADIDNKMLEMKEHCTVLVANAKELYENSVGEMSLRKVLKVLGLTDTLSEGEAWDKLEQKKIAKAFYPPTKRRRLLDMTKGSQSSTGKSTILFKPEAIRSILEN